MDLVDGSKMNLHSLAIYCVDHNRGACILAETRVAKDIVGIGERMIPKRFVGSSLKLSAVVLSNDERSPTLRPQKEKQGGVDVDASFGSPPPLMLIGSLVLSYEGE